MIVEWVFVLMSCFGEIRESLSDILELDMVNSTVVQKMEPIMYPSSAIRLCNADFCCSVNSTSRWWGHNQSDFYCFRHSTQKGKSNFFKKISIQASD